MTAKNVKDLAASIRQKLLNRSKSENQSFEEIVRRYAMERFLYRLGLSQYKEQLILKGALMFAVWKNSISRTTLDIDMLGRISNSVTVIEKCICDICTIKSEDDGLIFDPSTVKSESITKDADYVGRRVLFTGKLSTMRISMQIDIGFGDMVFPEPDRIIMPSFFDMPKAEILGYTKESAIAEKFHAMVLMGALNSRIKDFYDIWILSKTFDFTGERLSQAIKSTFERRDLAIQENITAFTDDFAKEKQSQWQVFRKKMKFADAPESFREITKQVETFLNPITLSLLQKSPQPKNWNPQSGWDS